MIRRNSPFAARRNNSSTEEEISNPLEALANLTDVWLVLAVALMMSLIAGWNLDITSPSVPTFEDAQLVEVEEELDLTTMESEDPSENSEYEELGRAYRDANGTVYIIEDPVAPTE